jgi:hypothetical protein
MMTAMTILRGSGDLSVAERSRLGRRGESIVGVPMSAQGLHQRESLSMRVRMHTDADHFCCARSSWFGVDIDSVSM